MECLLPGNRERHGDLVPEHTLFSRRTFLAAAGLGTAALVSGCSSTLTNPPKTSPSEWALIRREDSSLVSTRRQ